ncbi:hypothetical protein ABT336_14090 [Micromonospora sp. NPDC000207]|uniref:hypothetical protein n=1 Tax=Micromonospora sp. NPDC000207 TaxID=3154246 RepID=UPI00331ED875
MSGLGVGSEPGREDPFYSANIERLAVWLLRQDVGRMADESSRWSAQSRDVRAAVRFIDDKHHALQQEPSRSGKAKSAVKDLAGRLRGKPLIRFDWRFVSRPPYDRFGGPSTDTKNIGMGPYLMPGNISPMFGREQSLENDLLVRQAVAEKLKEWISADPSLAGLHRGGELKNISGSFYQHDSNHFQNLTTSAGVGWRAEPVLNAKGEVRKEIRDLITNPPRFDYGDYVGQIEGYRQRGAEAEKRARAGGVGTYYPDLPFSPPIEAYLTQVRERAKAQASGAPVQRAGYEQPRFQVAQATARFVPGSGSGAPADPWAGALPPGARPSTPAPARPDLPPQVSGGRSR